MNNEFENRAEIDRRLRAQIDPLTAQLSPVGRLELIARLMGDLVFPNYSGRPILMQQRRELERGGASGEEAIEMPAADASGNASKNEGGS